MASLSGSPSNSAKAYRVAIETRVGNHGRMTSRSSRPLGLASRRLNSTVSNDQRRRVDPSIAAGFVNAGRLGEECAIVISGYLSEMPTHQLRDEFVNIAGL